MEQKIKVPIYVYSKDSRELWRYDDINYAESDLESYDIDNYEAFDSNFRKLKLYSKDKFGRVGFKIVNDGKKYENLLLKYAKNEIKHLCKPPNQKNYASIEDILNDLPIKGTGTRP